MSPLNGPVRQRRSCARGPGPRASREAGPGFGPSGLGAERVGWARASRGTGSRETGFARNGFVRNGVVRRTGRTAGTTGRAPRSARAGKADEAPAQAPRTRAAGWSRGYRVFTGLGRVLTGAATADGRRGAFRPARYGSRIADRSAAVARSAHGDEGRVRHAVRGTAQVAHVVVRPHPGRSYPRVLPVLVRRTGLLCTGVVALPAAYRLLRYRRTTLPPLRRVLPARRARLGPPAVARLMAARRPWPRRLLRSGGGEFGMGRRLFGPALRGEGRGRGGSGRRGARRRGRRCPGHGDAAGRCETGRGEEYGEGEGPDAGVHPSTLPQCTAAARRPHGRTTGTSDRTGRRATPRGRLRDRMPAPPRPRGGISPAPADRTAASTPSPRTRTRTARTATGRLPRKGCRLRKGRWPGGHPGCGGSGAGAHSVGSAAQSRGTRHDARSRRRGPGGPRDVPRRVRPAAHEGATPHAHHPLSHRLPELARTRQP